MILHKIFHLHQTVEDAQANLADVSAYRDSLGGVEQAEFTGHGISHWQVRLAPMLKANVVMTDAESAAPGTLVFRSMDGNAEIFGMVTFHSIRSRLTEVDVMLDYSFRSPVMRLVDRVFGLGDRCLVRNLRALRAHFEGAPVPTRVRQVASMSALTLKAA